MKTLLTPVLLEYLTGQGYQYCLIRTNRIRLATADMLVVLTPVKERPLPRSYTENYDACFCMDQEPVQMAAGLDGVISMVEIPPRELPQYISFFMAHMPLAKGEV